LSKSLRSTEYGRGAADGETKWLGTIFVPVSQADGGAPFLIPSTTTTPHMLLSSST